MADFLTTLQAFESGNAAHPERGGSNIANTHEGTSSGQAQGFNQITTGTWKEFGGLAYAPTPMQATKEQQNAIAAKIPLIRWDPKTLAYLRNNGFSVNPHATLAENIAANHGTVGAAPPPHTPTPGVQGALAASNATPAATPAATPQSWLDKIINPPTDAQGNPIAGAKSPLQELSQASVSRLSSEGQTPKEEAPQQSSMGQGPGARNVGAGAQTYGQTINSLSQPLTWSAAPGRWPGMPASGLQGGMATQPYGMTLNSFQMPSQGLGYGVPDVGFGFG